MRVLDLGSGTGMGSEGFVQRRHTVTRIEYDPQFANVPFTKLQDLRTLTVSEGEFDVVLFWPPCGRFSVTNIGKHWTEDHQPRTSEAAEAWDLVVAGIRLIQTIKPRFFVIENPRAKLRRLMEIHYPSIPRVTIVQCAYGKKRQKPTDLWGQFPPSWTPRPMCYRGAPCHESQPRGSSAGSQGEGVDGAMTPLALSLEIAEACERDLLFPAPRPVI